MCLDGARLDAGTTTPPGLPKECIFGVEGKTEPFPEQHSIGKLHETINRTKLVGIAPSSSQAQQENTKPADVPIDDIGNLSDLYGPVKFVRTLKAGQKLAGYGDNGGGPVLRAGGNEFRSSVSQGSSSPRVSEQPLPVISESERSQTRERADSARGRSHTGDGFTLPSQDASTHT